MFPTTPTFKLTLTASSTYSPQRKVPFNFKLFFFTQHSVREVGINIVLQIAQLQCHSK